ncbi:MAG: hypothetical protein IJ053_05940 [Lachnospiraceae bacterium]|nr:hypothetical protein [Lachnospiraceae bacterium]
MGDRIRLARLRRDIFVELAAALHALNNMDTAKGKENYSFEYDSLWVLDKNKKYILDADLNLYSGRQYTAVDKNGLYNILKMPLVSFYKWHFY